MREGRKRVLLVLTSHAELGMTGRPTGAWLEELAAAYWTFDDAGLAVEIASPKGGEAPLDPMSKEAPWIGAAGKRFLADAHARGSLAATRELRGMEAADFDAIYIVGGAGAAFDFPGDVALGGLVSELFRRGAPVAAVCHGVLGLLAARREDGTELVRNRRVTGVSNAEEAAVQYTQIVPLLPENALIGLGANYSAAEPFAAHVVRDGNLMTGQNPASAAPLAGAVNAYLAMPPEQP